MTLPGSERLADRDDRRAIAESLDETLFVEAAAGTGKTTELVRRIVAVIRQGRGTLEDIVAVTFTEKAAGEMKLRLRAEIESARREAEPGGEEATNLERALEQLELAHIGTIHGFCTDLLKERPIEAGVDPAFQVAADDEAGRLLDAAFESWFQAVLDDPPEGIRRALRRDYGRKSGGPRAKLREAAWQLAEHRDFDASWKRPSFDREGALDRIIEQIRGLGDLAPRAANPDDWFTRGLDVLRLWARELRLREDVHGRDYDYVETRLRSLLRSYATRRSWNWTGRRGSDFGQGLDKGELIARRDALHAEIVETLDTVDADLAALLRDELRPVIDGYEELKRREGRLDFVDLLIRTRDLLRDDDSIRAHYQRRFTRVFIDEFQDTDPLQVEIAMLLCADDPAEADFHRISPVPGKLFLVGDPKQSIYRFRRADVAMYERTRNRLAQAGARVVNLTTSFRSQPRIQHAVNAAFVRRMTGSEDGSQAEYVPLDPFRDDLSDQPAVIALPVPEPYGRYGSVYKGAVEGSLPDAVGAFVDWLVNESGWKVTERERPDELVDVQARHVCLLFRRLRNWNNDVTRPYVRELEARAIPHVLVGGRSYFDREEVLAVRNALTAIEWPDDRLAVYGALRGPLFSLGDGTLLHFSHFMAREGAKNARLNPLRPYGKYDDLESMIEAGAPAELVAVSEALSILGELHYARNRRSIPETIQRLLAAVRAHAGIAIWPTGEQALANVLRVVDRARAYERVGASSFRAFLDRMEEEAERGQAEEAPIVEEGTEGVRMMTVHKAKGLEFPVVILADMTCNATFDTPTRYVDPEAGLWAQSLAGCAPLDLLENIEAERIREMAEADRLTYVAATRARDLLIVPALGDGRDGKGGFPEPGGTGDDAEWWLDSLRPGLYPPRGERRAPSADPSAQDLGAPPFGPESVIGRRDRDGVELGAPPGSVMPGLHVAAGGNQVVWWDPTALGLDVDAPTGERQKRLLDVDDQVQPTFSVEEGIAAHDRWQEGRAERLATGSVPGVRVTTAKTVAKAALEAGEALPAGAAVDWVEVPRPADEERPRGKGDGEVGMRFGNLVHETLSTISFAAGEDDVRAAVGARAARSGATAIERESAIRLVRRALEHEVIRPALGEGADVRREIPLFETASDGTIREGVADLAIRTLKPDGSGEWVIIDYKTDFDPAPWRAEYEHQVAVYAGILEAATGEPVRGVVLLL